MSLMAQLSRHCTLTKEKKKKLSPKVKRRSPQRTLARARPCIRDSFREATLSSPPSLPLPPAPPHTSKLSRSLVSRVEGLLCLAMAAIISFWATLFLCSVLLCKNELGSVVLGGTREGEKRVVGEEEEEEGEKRGDGRVTRQLSWKK